MTSADVSVPGMKGAELILNFRRRGAEDAEKQDVSLCE
jgi:hypothetical protein